MHLNGHHVKITEKYAMSDIVNSIRPICSKNCNTNTQVYVLVEKDHMESIDDYKDQSLSMILTPAAKKNLQENSEEDMLWTNENVDELLDRLEAQPKEAECTDSDSE